MSRACPDDSPLADEILAVCRDAILASLGVSTTANTSSHDWRTSGIQRPADRQNTSVDSVKLAARTIKKAK